MNRMGAAVRSPVVASSGWRSSAEFGEMNVFEYKSNPKNQLTALLKGELSVICFYCTVNTVIWGHHWRAVLSITSCFKKSIEHAINPFFIANNRKIMLG